VALTTQRQTLEQLWADGLSGTALLARHSDLVDDFIVECCEALTCATKNTDLAVVALGGYGRRELFPYSDIDVMILYRERLADEVQRVADAILYPLWDTGYEIGHGVRTIAESLSHAEGDFIFQVALLDGRLVAGSRPLFAELMAEFRHRFIDGRRSLFVGQLVEHARVRRAKFGNHGYMLEPNIKESRGGMRDIQSTLWAATAVFGLTDIDALIGAGMLLPAEGQRFREAHDMLVRVRNRLHYVSGRKNDQLFFELQEEIAEAFGYRNDGQVLAVEHFMRDVYGYLRTSTVTTDLLFERAQEVVGLTGDVRAPSRPVEKGIEIRGNRIHLIATTEQIRARPYVLMRVFRAAAHTGLALHYRTMARVSEHRGLITAKVRASPRMARAFFSVLLESVEVLPVLEALNDTGLLEAYIPEFARIKALAQHDIYHVFTVDQHLLQAVESLHQVVRERADVYEKVTARRPLFLAALLHDIGKRSGHDHSEYGAKLAEEAGRRMGFSENESDLLSFCIRYHLFVPENALRRDLGDGDFISQCGAVIGDEERLAMLYLLSVADSRATGPSAWSAWKSQLIDEFYAKVAAIFSQPKDAAVSMTAPGDQVVVDAELMRTTLLAELGDENDLKIAVRLLPDDYLRSFDPATIVTHLRHHRDDHRRIRQKSLLRAVADGETWSVLVMAPDKQGLLAKICGVLTLHNLIAINAKIFTWPDGTAVDMLDVRPVNGRLFEEYDWRAIEADLDLAVNHRLGLGYRLHEKLARDYGHHSELTGAYKTEVVIDNESSSQYSVIEVYAADFPGQLYRITQTLADMGINIHKAFIATEVEQLIDVFYVLDAGGERLEQPTAQRKIRDILLQVVADETITI
jgi:[protein-PII] uridylyltransferase